MVPERASTKRSSSPCGDCGPMSSTSIRCIGPTPTCRSRRPRQRWRILQRAGKIRVIGVSNFSPAQIDAFRKVAPVHTVQPPYNLFERGIESDVLPYCRERNIVTLAYGPCAGGCCLAACRSRRNSPGTTCERVTPSSGRLGLRNTCGRLNGSTALRRKIMDGASSILRCAGSSTDRTSMIALWGARRPDQLAPLAGLSGWHINSSAMVEIDRILSETIVDPIGPEFMAPPDQLAA